MEILYRICYCTARSRRPCEYSLRFSGAFGRRRKAKLAANRPLRASSGHASQAFAVPLTQTESVE